MGYRVITPATIEDACDRCGCVNVSHCGEPSPGQLERLPAGWSLMGRYLAASPHPAEWLLCPRCTTDLELVLLPLGCAHEATGKIVFTAVQGPYQGKGSDSYLEAPADDFDVEDVPEGAEARGGGVVVAPHPLCDIDGCGQEAMIDGVGGRFMCVDCAAESLGVPPSPRVMLEALRVRTAASRARQRKPCEGPLHIAGALGTCHHLGWFSRGDHTVCLPCAQAYDELVRPNET